MAALWNLFRSRKNYDFYSMRCKGKPLDNIDSVHEQYFAKYDFLEENNNYMEWLFPIYGSAGINHNTKPLSMQEAELFKKNIQTSIRLVRSYKLMLNFFGMKLANDLTGEVTREEDIWQARYCQINSRTNNNIKITRMLKSLGQLGFERYQKRFVEHLKTEIEEHGLLKNCRDNFKNYWSTYLKLGEDFKNESVFFQHAQTQTEQYRTYVQADERFLENNKQKIKEIYDALNQKTNTDQLYSIEKNNEDVGGSSFFKVHYNSEEEEQKARILFLENIQKGRAEAEAKRQKALKSLSESGKKPSA
jgi:hypothetical protein